MDFPFHLAVHFQDSMKILPSFQKRVFHYNCPILKKRGALPSEKIMKKPVIAYLYNVRHTYPDPDDPKDTARGGFRRPRDN